MSSSGGPLTDGLLCSICLEVFTDPVSTSCGHNFCKTCLNKCWDNSQTCSCPYCKETFKQRPDLKINSTLRELADHYKPKSPEKTSDVLCDYCEERKMKALKSCVVCQSSYCQTHLERHLRVAALKKHKLMDPVSNLEDYMCQEHEKPLDLFCRDDQTCVCSICSVKDHKNHKTVPIEEESKDGWLDKYCTDLGHRNLTFIATPNDGSEDQSRGATNAEIVELDGCIPADGFKIIKATVIVLLEHIVNKKLKEICLGCEVDHPSQLRHSCLFDPNAYFFNTYFEELTHNLIKPELKHIIAQTPNRCGLRINPQRIQGTVDAILCELRDEVFIVEKLREIREKVVDAKSEQVVYDAVDCWKSRAYTETV